MEVCLVTHKGPETGFGRYADGVRQALAKTDLAVTWARFDDEARRLTVTDPDGGDRSSSWSARLPRWIGYRQAWQASGLAEFQGAVHFTNHHLAGLPARRKVATIHDLYHLDAAGLRSRIGRGLYGGLHSCMAWTAISGTTASRARHFLPGVPGHVSGIGVDGSVGPGLATRRGMLHVGEAGHRKGLDLLPQVVAATGEQMRQVGGIGRGRKRLQGQINAAGCGDAWTWVGPVAPGELEAEYAAARAVVMPSRHEGFGLPVAEAMSRGVPVIASDIPVFRELFHDGAVLAPREPDAWIDAWRNLADDDRWNEQRAAGLRCAGQFRWDNVATSLIAWYESLPAS